jgi:S-adenosylmethionine:tRNA ribosyltransferase-isomerase
VPRDGVRLLVARPDGVVHHRFRDLPDLLEPGDLVVVNTSATVPSALIGLRDDGRATTVHVAGQLDDGDWVVELRRRDGLGPDLAVRAGERVRLPSELTVRLVEPHPNPAADPSRLWRGRPSRPGRLTRYLASNGHPIGYRYLGAPVPLEDLQNVYATEPGSAEMASAGRPFTAALIVRLVAAGVAVAPIVLHAGVSSPELHEPPTPERFEVTEATARLVNGTRAAGGRVIAVGTTVVRALETVAAPGGIVHSDRGWTNLVLGPDRLTRAVTGLVTGLHAPEASHLSLLEAVAGTALVRRAYEEAVRGRYLWHEFGDSMLFLPPHGGA